MLRDVTCTSDSSWWNNHFRFSQVLCLCRILPLRVKTQTCPQDSSQCLVSVDLTIVDTCPHDCTLGSNASSSSCNDDDDDDSALRSVCRRVQSNRTLKKKLTLLYTTQSRKLTLRSLILLVGGRLLSHGLASRVLPHRSDTFDSQLAAQTMTMTHS